MIGNKHIMNGSDKSIGKVDLMKASESYGVNNSLKKEKLTCLNNQDIMTIQSVVINQNGMFETSNGYGINMNSIATSTKVIMNLKLEMKLGQLMKICFQLTGMVENSLIQMKEDQVVDVCKIITKVEDFDEVMLVVQVQVGKFEVKDVLLDNGSSVNIISKSLKKKLELKKPQLAPFVV